MLRRLLAHPLTRGSDLDAPETTQLRKQIIQGKPFLRKVYEEWYRGLSAEIPQGEGAILELGSGAGFLHELEPAAISSDIFYVSGLNVVLDAQRLPFAAGSLKAILMTNVLHHLPDPKQVFNEAARCVRPGGVMATIEPWITSWSRFVYTRLHHETVDDSAQEWGVRGQGPLSGANSALPWIIFWRDRAKFEREFPVWNIEQISLLMPFRYLLSGGVSLRSLMFGWTFGFWRGLENVFRPWMPHLAMFAKIVLVRK